LLRFRRVKSKKIDKSEILWR